jgi:hypothetical protein
MRSSSFRDRHYSSLGLILAAVSLTLGLCGQRAQAAEDHVEWSPLTKQALDPGDKRYFDLEYKARWADEVLAELGAAAPGETSTRGDYARAALGVLEAKLPSTNRMAAQARPAVPGWLLEGYSRFQPRAVARSRWLSDLIAGMQGQPQVNPLVRADADIAALYAYWCMYDAEWFNASRNAGFKAWLSALQLSYPTAWQRLSREDQAELHSRLVLPLQTKDEAYREIDNWIEALQRNAGGFTKPLVRRALVEELLQRGGYNPPDENGRVRPIDPRLFEDPAYKAGAPSGLGMTDREFFLLAALSVEFSGELNLLQPDLPQLRPFADYFVAAFQREQ